MIRKIEENQVKLGYPTPLGPSKRGQGINFALFSSHAQKVSLCLFLEGSTEIFQEIAFDKKKNKTGNVWHMLIEDYPVDLEYGFRLHGPYNLKKGHLFTPKHIVSDPFSRELSWSPIWNDPKDTLKSKVVLDGSFDWQGVHKPNLNLSDLIIYEMHIRGFTKDQSSKTKNPGTFLGVIEKIPYLKKLGINAVELLPIFEFDETSNSHINPQTKKKLTNYWGYSPVNFFTPMKRYMSSTSDICYLNQFKTMVRELHRNNIEVILDVVYNHTAEGGGTEHVLNFKGIDNSTYYLLDTNGHYLNFSGCGNTFSCNSIVGKELILESLRFWVSEMKVDGFRFDLASILTRDEKGNPMEKPPLIEAISLDPVLEDTKLIAEAWDCAGLYQVGTFPSWGKWMEWNGSFRDTVKRYIKGDTNLKGEFATVLFGSQNLYGDIRTPCHSVNYISSHDGFSLCDLVSYDQKHNEENGENNQDGMNNNHSHNYGFEGPSKDPAILSVRNKQIKNFFVCLLISQGTPMLTMGDEIRHTKKGNNNSWCQDNRLNWFHWDELEKNEDIFTFVSQLIAFRKNHPCLGHPEFFKEKDVDWHSTELFNPKWDEDLGFLSFNLKEKNNNCLYIAFNPTIHLAEYSLPELQDGLNWYLKVDTSLNFPKDFSEDLTIQIKEKYLVNPQSIIILQSS